ncbi:Pycsar system effector family protein [Flexivirga meconopsidis]|uniref:Pycsar system effector family protein n=1 Tax=Flexivirga meconopsidis TaxID=2977121 RepID=UPI002240C6C8|nr:Pycsar system effector family protein [Flexivirga meconopsidis]
MTDNLWRVLEHTNDWLRFADTKAAGSLAGSGVFGGLAANALFDHSTQLSCTARFFVVAGLVALLAATALALYVVVPRLKVGEPTSLIYYEHVARKYKKDPDAHHADLMRMLGDPDETGKQLANQIWANATVARQKYLFSSWSLLALAIAVLLLAVGTVIAATT